MDWNYALALPLEAPGFDASVLCEFRARLIAGKAERRLFDTRLTLLRDQGLVKAGGAQRTDSTHALAVIHTLNRLELLGETLRHALHRLAVVAPEWLLSWGPPAWFERYGKQISNYRLPSSQVERTRLAEQIGTHGRTLLTMLHAAPAPPWAREVPAVATLQQVWQQQYQDVPATEPMRLRPPADLAPASELICSPDDPEARYRRKRDTEWVGYAVHLTESCDDELPHGLTNIETTVATGTDNQMTGTLHQHLAKHKLTPSEHYVDAGSVTAEHLVSSQKQGTDLSGPVNEEQSWQAQAGEGFGAAAFRIDWAAQQAMCPQGKPSVSWKRYKDSHKHAVVCIRWARTDWQNCPVRSKCVKTTRPRAIMIRLQAEHEALQAARARQHTAEFKEVYQRRAGSEGTINQGVQLGALRRTRYVGLAKTKLLHLLIGAAMNLVRVAAWLAEVPRARTRTSPFARLAPAYSP